VELSSRLEMSTRLLKQMYCHVHYTQCYCINLRGSKIEAHVLNLECAILQIYGDPDAADVVFTSGADIDVVGINIITQVCFKGLSLYISIISIVQVVSMGG
jgi:hypothetical protein